MKIVAVDGYHLNPGDLSWSGIEQYGDLEVHDSSTYVELFERSKSADIILTNKAVFDAPLLGKLKNLKFICVTATGYNNVDVEKARKLGIIVSNVSGYSTDSVAQHVFASLFAILNKIETYSNQSHKGEWTLRKDWSYTIEPIINISGLTMGIIGFGKIGQRVAQIALAFGMNVIAFNKHPERDKMENVSFTDLSSILANSDVISLHVPLNKTTHEMINEISLNLMKKTSILINTGRGPLINEHELYLALKNKVIRAAALDVLVQEPPKANNPLLSLDNCIITPHIAWAGYQARKRMMELLQDNLKAFVEDNPINVVNA